MTHPNDNPLQTRPDFQKNVAEDPNAQLEAGLNTSICNTKLTKISPKTPPNRPILSSPQPT
jgi:hypothetical protein